VLENGSVIIDVTENGLTLAFNIDEKVKYLNWNEVLAIINSDYDKDQWVEGINL
jgi:hypothetical protein